VPVRRSRRAAIAAQWIASLPHRHKVIVAGNHDGAFVREPGAARAMFAGAHYLEDAEVTIEGLRFYGSPWQPAFHDWAFNLQRGAALAAVWAKIPRGVDVLITHGPPNGIGDSNAMVQRSGCADLRHWVARVMARSPKSAARRFRGIARSARSHTTVRADCAAAASRCCQASVQPRRRAGVGRTRVPTRRSATSVADRDHANDSGQRSAR